MAFVSRGRNDVVNFPVQDCHDGQGTIYVRQLLGYEPLLPVPGNPSDFDSLINFIHETTLPPGTTIGLHPHDGNEEVYIVTEGVGEMTVDGVQIVMGPGTATLTKSGSKHTFRNAGDTDCKIIVIESVFNPKDKKK